MESLGCVSSPEDYSQGFSMLSEKQHTYITAANWDTAALIDNELKIVYSTESYNIGKFEVHRKSDYSLIHDTGQLLGQKKHLLLDALKKMSEFM
jgi:membrane-anchored protein YejM (alkaline phosphatase superfamily)